MKRAMTMLAVVSGAAVTGIATSIDVSPPAHDYMSVVNGQSGWSFRVTMPRSTNPLDTVKARIVGRDASQFAIAQGPAGGVAGLGASNCAQTWRSGSCIFVVVFRPTSMGGKGAELEVVDGAGNTDRAALVGVVVAGCRPYLVPCNYLDLYDGVISSRTALETAGQNQTSRTGRWVTETTVTIANGTVWCTVGRDDSETEFNGGKPRTRSSQSGAITGEGMAAIEFRKGDNGLEYTLKFACPDPATTGTAIDYEANTSSAISTPATPSKWTGSVAVDPQLVKSIGLPLTGKQIDPYENVGSNDGVQGGTTTTWSLKAWR